MSGGQAAGVAFLDGESGVELDAFVFREVHRRARGAELARGVVERADFIRRFREDARRLARRSHVETRLISEAACKKKASFSLLLSPLNCHTAYSLR